MFTINNKFIIINSILESKDTPHYEYMTHEILSISS